MMQLVKLRFKAPVHIGEAGLGLEESARIVHSDTLYSAVFQTWLRVFGEAPPEFRLSSAFPFAGERYYFPRPLLPAPGYTNELALKYGKQLKRARFIERKHFVRWIKGEPLDYETLIEETQVLESVMETRVRPHVTLDRRRAASVLYFVGETVFDDRRDAGLFFLVDVQPEDWPRFQTVLTVLGEEGIGGRRSQGYGVFEPEFSGAFAIEQVSDPNAYLTLSLVYPDNSEEVRDNLVAYHLVERTGWLESMKGNLGRRHQRVLMFGEGSLFRRPVRGKLVNVAPPGFAAHPVVYRNGRAFIVGVRREEGNP